MSSQYNQHNTTQHNTTQHNTTSIIVPNNKIRITVIGSAEGVLNVINSFAGSKNYICNFAVIESYYSKNFWRTFFRLSLKEKVRMLLKTIKTYYKLRGRNKNNLAGIKKYFALENLAMQDIFAFMPSKIFAGSDIFLLARNDDDIDVLSVKSSDYAAWLIKNGVSKENIFIVPSSMSNPQISVLKNDNLLPLCKNLTSAKPVLRYMEYHVTDFCNLKCKGCGHLANHVKVLDFAGSENFRVALEKLKEKFRNIITLRIMGGEPLLCKELHEYINAAHEIFPYSNIKIVTNGLLYKNITPLTVKAIRNAGAEIQVTQYPPTREIAGEIVSFCEENGIKLLISSLITKFFRCIISDENADYHKTWFTCGSRTCHFLHNTEFFPCPHVFTCGGEKFKDIVKDRALTQNEYDEFSYNLTKNINDDGWDILAKFETPMKICKKCGDKQVYFKWESEA